MNLVAPFGFFGAGNIGDESTLQGFAQLISGYGGGVRVSVASRNPSHTAKVEPSFRYYKARERSLKRAWAELVTRGYVMVGGTPIMDVLGGWPLVELTPIVEAAHAQNRSVVFLGIGTETLNREKSRETISKSIAPRVAYWTVRSAHDMERLIDYGVPGDRITVAADLAWLVKPVDEQSGRRQLESLGVEVGSPLVGVNVNGERFVIEREPKLFEKMAKFLDQLVENQGVKILFLCNEVREGETYDTAASRGVLEQMKHSQSARLVPNRYLSPQEMLSIIRCCSFTVGIRYHFCLFSALEGVPFVAIKRSDKVADLCWDMEWPYAVELADLSVSELSSMASDICSKRAELVELLEKRVDAMRQRSLGNRIALSKLVNGIER
jgi:polysaccharide pyruvyl transferase WcaK-like protein